MRVGVLAGGDPSDVRTWSGVPYFMTRAIREHFDDLVYIPSEQHRYERVLNGITRLTERSIGRRLIAHTTPLGSRMHARTIEPAVLREGIDILVSITVDPQISYLETDVPIVQLSDTTFAGVEDYYPKFSNLLGVARRWGHDLTRRSLENADLCIYPSRWAANSARYDYGVPPEKIRVIPYGANLESPPPRDQALDAKLVSSCQLLFVGVDWERKGGDIAYETLVELNRRGVDASLVVVGCKPPADCTHEKLRVMPFLNKQIPEQLATYQSLWSTSAFFLLPSRGETFGAVFCEAAANGLPAIATDTGGVSDAVKNGISGYVLAPEAGNAAYADVIERVWTNPEDYNELVRRTRDRFEHELSWTAWASQIAPLMSELVSQRNQR